MLDMRVKKFFFDRPRVLKAVRRAQRQVMTRAGGLIRKIAQQSIRTRKTPSQPGRPPHSHTGLLKKHIYFSYEPGAERVVIGPVPLTRPTDAPHILEFGGGTVTTRPRLIPVGEVGRDKKGKFTKRKRKRIPPGTRLKTERRPYMGPALEKARPKLPALWRDSVRG